MRIHKSVKNIFLGILFLSFVILPTFVNAAYDVQGDTSKTINNLSTGSYYSQKITTGGPMSPASGYTYSSDPKAEGGIASNLYSSNETLNGTELDSSRFNGLKTKLAEGGSSAKDISIKDVYQINSKTGSIFILKDKDGQDKIIAQATSDNRMYVPKEPILKESGSADSLDPKTGSGFLNLTDKDRGLDIGTTANYKNAEYNKTQEKEGAQAEYDRLNQEAIKKENYAKQLQNDQSATQADITRAIQEAREARTQADNAGRNVAIIGNQLAQIQNQKALTAPQPSQDNCSGWSSITSFYCNMMLVAKFANIIFKLASFIAYIVGRLFDYSLELSMNSAEFFEKLGVIEITWSFVRDILNITFIFILLWTAIQILLGNDAQYNAKKVLMNVVVVAILINFSLFAAKLMVDGSNIVSLKIYEAMKASTEEKTATISERVMNTVGLSALYNINQIFDSNNTAAKPGSACEGDPGALITISVMGTIFLIVLSLALGLAGVLFLIRLMNILILFIKSPLWVWGHVLPGNKYMDEIRNKWWSEMKHVLTFPIMYMFWMLVAIIVFDKLGKVKSVADGSGTETTLLDLICQRPSGGLGSSISLFAIFFIVIILMMKAVQYGIKHSSASDDSIGSGMAKKVSNKFGSWQDSVTKGLARKTGTVAVGAGSLAAGAGIGAAKWGTTKSLNLAGRTGVGLAKGAFGEKDFKEGFSDGFLNPSINTKEWLRDKAKAQVANGGIVGELTGLTRAADKLMNKYKDPKNNRGETREEAEKRRDKRTKTREESIQEIAAGYKILSQEEWEKKHGEIGTDSSKVAEYKKYIDDVISKRSDVALGKGLIGMQNKNTGKSHLESIRDRAVEERVDDKTGKFKIKVSNYAIEDGFDNMLNYYKPGGDGASDLDKGFKKGMWWKGPFKKRDNVVRIKTAQSSIRERRGKHANEQNKKIAEDKAREKLKNLQEIQDSTLDSIVNDSTKNLITGKAEKIEEVRQINSDIKKRRKLVEAKLATTDSAKKAELEEKIIDMDDKLENKINRLKETREKLKAEIDKKEDVDKK